MFVAGTTAYAAVHAVSLKAGDTVVISGPAGGVGSITVQLAEILGAKVPKKRSHAQSERPDFMFTHKWVSKAFELTSVLSTRRSPASISSEWNVIVQHTSARSARDRDRLRQEVLEGLGWRLHRIWSTDWFETHNARPISFSLQSRMRRIKRVLPRPNLYLMTIYRN